MDYQIAFPHLGIRLDHVPKGFQIGSFTIACYGIMIAIGMLLGISAVCRRAKATGQSADDYLDISIWTMLIAIIGARIYYVAFTWSYYKKDLLSILNLREGGLAIYGGLIAGVLALLLLSKKKRIAFPVILDTVAIGIPIGQILGRWGNFFNREAFGGYTDSLLAMQLPVSAVRQGEITQAMWEHAAVIDGISFIQVHPTFLYEGLWNCGVLLFLFLMRNRTVFRGELFLYYLAGYGIGRFFIERLRTDQLLIPGTGIPVSMAVSAAAAVISLVLIIRGRRTAAVKTAKK
ncbi:MAG: prolipoprotein diacylglyceryl transferase [Lachnospiraceae bacterium]|nr:prolipoprotein diacylglyceryl transferase [Lachnospiraceae bacterium]